MSVAVNMTGRLNHLVKADAQQRDLGSYFVALYTRLR